MTLLHPRWFAVWSVYFCVFLRLFSFPFHLLLASSAFVFVDHRSSCPVPALCRLFCRFLVGFRRVAVAGRLRLRTYIEYTLSEAKLCKGLYGKGLTDVLLFVSYCFYYKI